MPEFTCAMCGGTFKVAGSDADAQKEYEATFSADDRATDPPVIVCDRCYKAMVTEYPPEQWEADRRRHRSN